MKICLMLVFWIELPIKIAILPALHSTGRITIKKQVGLSPSPSVIFIGCLAKV